MLGEAPYLVISGDEVLKHYTTRPLSDLSNQEGLVCAYDKRNDIYVIKYDKNQDFDKEELAENLGYYLGEKYLEMEEGRGDSFYGLDKEIYVDNFFMELSRSVVSDGLEIYDISFEEFKNRASQIFENIKGELSRSRGSNIIEVPMSIGTNMMEGYMEDFQELFESERGKKSANNYLLERNLPHRVFLKTLGKIMEESRISEIDGLIEERAGDLLIKEMMEIVESQDTSGDSMEEIMRELEEMESEDILDMLSFDNFMRDL